MKNKSKTITVLEHGSTTNIKHEIPNEVETPEIGDIIHLVYESSEYKAKVSRIIRKIDLVNNVETINIFCEK